LLKQPLAEARFFRFSAVLWVRCTKHRNFEPFRNSRGSVKKGAPFLLASLKDHTNSIDGNIDLYAALCGAQNGARKPNTDVILSPNKHIDQNRALRSVYAIQYFLKRLRTVYKKRTFFSIVHIFAFTSSKFVLINFFHFEILQKNPFL
jgi:hypothetical protein